MFGHPFELWFKILAVGIGSIILYLYIGWTISLAWSAAFIIMNAVQYAFAKARQHNATKIDLYILVILSNICLALFMWLPTYMFVHPDKLISIAGGTAMAAKLVYLAHIADRLKFMIACQLLVLSCVSIWIIYANRAEYDTVIAFLGQVFVFSALMGSIGICLFAARHRRLQVRLAAARLAQAQKMEAIGHVSGGIAHHFNNLLAVIIGNIELCDDAKDEAERHKLRDNAHNAALNGKRLVELMLEFTRQQNATLQRLSAKDLLDTVVELETKVASDEISISADAAPPDCHVLVDKDLFLSAMIHLVSNAHDAIKNSGTIHITVSHDSHKSALTTVTGRQIPPGDYVAFHVRDHGPGIKPHHLPRLAEPFFTTKPVGQGAGLGLSMVAGFTERHNGGLLINSSANGTTASILLPTHVV